MTKSSSIILLVILALIIAGAWYYFNYKNPGLAPTSGAAVAGPGGRCGGNMTTAPVCGPGYQCTPDPNSHLPFGDVGGMCVQIVTPGSVGY